MFQAALACAGLPAARVVPWIDLLKGRASLPRLVPAGAVVRIESPGKDFEVERELLLLGAAGEDDPRFSRVGAEEVRSLEFDRGRILWPRQWYRGFRRALADVGVQLSACPPHRLTNDPADVELMFDKVRCHALLDSARVAVPRSLGRVASWDELVRRMKEAHCPRVFVKLAHGSSASGVVAYQTDGRRHQAVTTAEWSYHLPGGRGHPGLRLYNTRRLRTYRRPEEIRLVVDELCRHNVHVEQWLPKAGMDGAALDLRVLVIAGRARHVVVRASRSPLTNLHLLNARGDAARLRLRMGEEHWRDAMATCERAAACFPGSLHAGIDLLIGADFRRHAVLEVNAFGDLLPGVLDGSEDPYAAELRAVLMGQEDVDALIPSPSTLGEASGFGDCPRAG